MEKLRAEVNEKNLQHFYDYRAVNGYYVYGDRKNAFSGVNFPPEFAKLHQMIANRDRRIRAVTPCKSVPATIDDSDTGELPKIETVITPAEAEIKTPDAMLATFRRVRNQFVRLGGGVPRSARSGGDHVRRPGPFLVATMGTFPMYLPGQPVDDKILIFEDTTATAGPTGTRCLPMACTCPRVWNWATAASTSRTPISCFSRTPTATTAPRQADRAGRLRHG